MLGLREFVGGSSSSKLRLLAVTLSGTIKLLSIESASSMRAKGTPYKVTWEASTRSITKVNGLAASALTRAGGGMTLVAVGGLGADGKGFMEIFLVPEALL